MRLGAFGPVDGTGLVGSIGPPGLTLGAPGSTGAVAAPPVCTYFGSTAGWATTAVCSTPAGAVSKSQEGTSVWSPATNCVDSPKTAPRTSVGRPLPGTHGSADGSVLSWPGTVGVAWGVCDGSGLGIGTTQVEMPLSEPAPVAACRLLSAEAALTTG